MFDVPKPTRMSAFLYNLWFFLSESAQDYLHNLYSYAAIPIGVAHKAAYAPLT